MSPWARGLMVKSTIISGFEGALTWDGYDQLTEDERDFLIIFLRETGKARKKNMGD